MRAKNVKAFAVEQEIDITQEEIDTADALFAEMEETLTANGYTQLNAEFNSAH